MIISVIRTFFLYIVIIVAIRLMGKRQISDLQTSELVVTMLLSNIASIPMQNTAQPLLSGFVPMLILVICEIFISVVMLKRAKFRRIICGKPQIIIDNGKIDQIQMKRLRLSVEDLFIQLRQLNIFYLEDVQYAIVETNGKMSVLKKASAVQPTVKDLKLQVEDKGIETVIISDGEISKTSAQLCGVDDSWIAHTLKSNNVNQHEVFIMTADQNKKYNIVLKESKKRSL